MLAPGGFVAPETVARARTQLTTWGLQPTVAAHAQGRCQRFSAPDADRLSDLQQALDDPKVRAVLALRGGYGTARLVDALDLTGFMHAPKWVAGFSDLTTLLARVNLAGYQALHATMPVMFDAPHSADALDSLRRALWGEQLTYHVPPHPHNRTGAATGTLTGGTLSLVCDGIGTATDVAGGEKILFLEDIGEPLYKIDRMMRQLRRAGKLSQLAGLVVGQFTDVDPGDPPFADTVEAVVADVVANYRYPVAYGFPVGHVGRNLALPCGRTAHLTVTADGTKLQTLDDDQF